MENGKIAIWVDEDKLELLQETMAWALDILGEIEEEKETCEVLSSIEDQCRIKK